MAVIATAPGLESGLRILHTIGETGEASFIQLKQLLDLSPSSLSRYLKILTEKGFIEKNEEQHYIFGSAMKKLSPQVNHEPPFGPVISSVLDDIGGSLGLTALWIGFENGTMVCRDKRIAPEGVAMQNVGSERTDYTIHPWGFLFLAHQKEEYRRFLIEHANVFPAYQSYIPDQEDLARFIAEALEKGYSDDYGTIFPHIRRIAVPLFAQSRLTAVIGVGMIGTSFPESTVNHIVSKLRQTSSRLMQLEL